MTVDANQETVEKNLAILLVLQNELHKINNFAEFGFFITNETHRLQKYDFAIFWQIDKLENATIQTISGLIDVDKQTAFVQKITQALRHFLSRGDAAKKLSNLEPEEFAQQFFNEYDDFSSYVLWCPFENNNAIRAGLMLFREDPWLELDIKVMTWLVQSYQYTFQFLNKDKSSTSWFKRLQSRKVKLAVAGIITIILLMPVRLSTVGTAVVIPKSPTIIAAPFQGVIEKVNIIPGSMVRVNQILFTLDKTELAGNVTLARKELLLTEAKLRKSIQQGYSEDNETNRAEIPILEAQTKIDQTRIDYYQSLLEKSDVKASVAGLVIFDNKDDWIGQPVQTGERILKIANPDNTQVAIEIPVSDFISLKIPSSGKFYPSGSISALPITVENISYNAKLSPNKILAYRITARFDAGSKPLRIGLEGTATLYSRYVPFIVYLLRKPIHVFRQYFGL